MSLMAEDPNETTGRARPGVSRTSRNDDMDTDDERGATVLYGAEALRFSVQSSGSQGQPGTDK